MLDVAIIGCGVVGAAAAYELSHYPLHTAIFEAENDVADCTTKANSAILHAGYDPEPGTRMARLNVEGVALAKGSAPGWMCRTGSAAVWCWPSARRSCRICRSCTKTALPMGCRASGCCRQRKHGPWSPVFRRRWPERCMHPARPSSARGNMRWPWRRWRCATGWNSTSAARSPAFRKPRPAGR